MSAAAVPEPVSIVDGKYSIIRELGSGGTGVVYEAESLSVGKKVALKLMNADAFAGPDSQVRFITEARAAARISHANVVDVHDLGISREGAPYVVMDLLRGETLEQMIDARGPLAPAYACELVLQVLAGLAAAHAQGIVHCDLKPGNVLVTHPRPDRPLVKVLDFGIARGVEAAQAAQRDSGVIMGTPMYMAPEQVEGGHVDFRTDVYQVSAMLFAMLAGCDPFEGSASRDVMKQVAKGKTRDLQQLVPELAPELVAVVKEGMALAPGDRMRSAEELAERLRQFATATPSASLAANHAAKFVQPMPLIVAPTPDLSKASALPASQASSAPLSMPRISVMRESLLLSPRIPRAPSAPKLRMGQDFMPMPGEPEYRELIEARRSQTHVPRRRGSFRRDLMPALIATGIGFGIGIALAWSAGLL